MNIPEIHFFKRISSSVWPALATAFDARSESPVKQMLEAHWGDQQGL